MVVLFGNFRRFKDCQRRHHLKVKIGKKDKRMVGWQLHVNESYPKLLHYVGMK